LGLNGLAEDTELTATSDSETTTNASFFIIVIFYSS
jgi:hypothetical protein